jgi:DNA-binding GntR family transcriptional regulator
LEDNHVIIQEEYFPETLVSNSEDDDLITAGLIKKIRGHYPSEMAESYKELHQHRSSSRNSNSLTTNVTLISFLPVAFTTQRIVFV